MRNRIFIGLAVLASAICSTALAQDNSKASADVPAVQLNNGIMMPQFGLGTFLQPSATLQLQRGERNCGKVANQFITA